MKHGFAIGDFVIYQNAQWRVTAITTNSVTIRKNFSSDSITLIREGVKVLRRGML